MDDTKQDCEPKQDRETQPEFPVTSHTVVALPIHLDYIRDLEAMLQLSFGIVLGLLVALILVLYIREY